MEPKNKDDKLLEELAESDVYYSGEEVPETEEVESSDAYRHGEIYEGKENSSKVVGVVPKTLTPKRQKGATIPVPLMYSNVAKRGTKAPTIAAPNVGRKTPNRAKETIPVVVKKVKDNVVVINEATNKKAEPELTQREIVLMMMDYIGVDKEFLFEYLKTFH
jgi:hypothetical protein